jgi:SAM-dependent methyltransferase
MDNGYLTFRNHNAPIMRRVQGDHDLRLDGISDLLTRARGATAFDIGCDNAAVSDDFARNGATRVMGCDIDRDCIIASRHRLRNLRCVPHRFEVVDLTGGPTALKTAFGSDADLKHDIVTMLATFHKLKRIMSKNDLSTLMMWFGARTIKYFGWRGYEDEIAQIDADLGNVGLRRIHTSMISDIQPAAIWARK